MTITPQNSVVFAGERAESRCHVDRNSTVIGWEVLKSSAVFEIESIDVVDKSFGLPLVNSTHIGFDMDYTGSGLIYFNVTELEDAGIYTCRALIGPDQESIFYSAQLVVFGE